MKKTLLIPSLVIALLLSSSLAFAWPGGSGSGQGKGYNKGACGQRGQGMTYEQHQERMANRLDRMAIILDLTDQQKTQLTELADKQWQNHQAMRTEMQADRDAIREYKFGKDFNEAEFRSMVQKHNEAKTNMMVEKAKLRQQMFAALTPEQQAKAEKLWDTRGGGMFGGGMHGGGMMGAYRDCDGSGPRGGGMMGGSGKGCRN